MGTKLFRALEIALCFQGSDPDSWPPQGSLIHQTLDLAMPQPWGWGHLGVKEDGRQG